MDKVNEMVALVAAEQLPMQDATNIKNEFLRFFDQVAEWDARARELVVTDASQKYEMDMARSGRLGIKAIRVEADKTRKRLKEDSIRYGRAVQGVYNLVLAAIEPIETHLKEQEEFVLRQAQRERAALHEERVRQIEAYFEFVPINTDFGVMTEEYFQTVLAGAQAQAAAKIEAEQKAEQERIEREQAEAAERQRMAEENARLRQEAAQAQAALKIEQETRARIEAERAAEHAAICAKEAARIAESNRKIIAAAADEQNRLASDNPDKWQLIQLATALEQMEMPNVLSVAGKAALREIKQQIIDVSTFIHTKAENL